MRTDRFSLLRCTAVGAALTLLAGCSGDGGGEKVPNNRPEVRITGGPLDGSEASYTARIFWTGWDFDGVVRHFEYAVDPPPVFSLEEINAVNTDRIRNFPDVSVETVTGPAEGQDTLRVSKVVDGTVHAFDWVQTIEFSRSFAFETPQADSTFQPGSGQLLPDPTFSGIHTVYVRALDNDGMYSEVDNNTRISYTAMTVTPSAEIMRPEVEGGILTVGPSITVCWDGLDPDSPEANKKPTAYTFKLLSPSVNIIGITNPGILYDDHSEDGWIWQTQGADTLCYNYFLDVPRQYVFGVRAVDVAGGVEPFMEFGRNAFKFQALAGAGVPRLTLCEASIGCLEYQGLGVTRTKQVPVGSRLRFSWSASAEDYGGTIEGYSWGVDITDLDREGPGSGWSGWGPILGNINPITWDQPGVHVLYIRVRDLSGGITLATLILEVVDFPLDKDVLFVDDFKDGTFPRDHEHDQFWLDLFENSGRFEGEDVQVDKFDAHGTDDAEILFPVAPELSEMGRYKLLVWSLLGSGYDGHTSMVVAATQNRHLGAYLNAGGKAWITGGLTMAAMTAAGSGIGDTAYPKEMRPGLFPWDFLKLFSADIRNDKGEDNRSNSFEAAIPASDVYPGVRQIYPRMDLARDPPKLHPIKGQLGGVSHADAVFGPIFTADVKGFTGELDSLYAYGAHGPLVKGRNSTYHRKLCATRWHNPDEDRRQGRVQWFGFPFYYMRTEQAQEVFNLSIDWFREETVIRD